MKKPITQALSCLCQPFTRLRLKHWALGLGLLGLYITPALAWGDDSRIAFLSFEADQAIYLYQVKPSGEDLTLLAPRAQNQNHYEDQYNRQFSWSPDGQYLLFMQRYSDKNQLMLIRKDGSGLQRVNTLSGAFYDPNWSPDGKQIIFTFYTENTQQIFTQTLGQAPVPLVSDIQGAYYPVWSPNGQYVAFLGHAKNGHKELFLKNLKNNQSRQLTQNAEIEYEPDWSATSETLVYLSQADENADWEMQSLDLASGKTTLLTQAPLLHSPRWHPQQKKLLFSARYGDDDNTTQIYTLDLLGGQPQALTQGSGLKFGANWSPDGSQIVYTHNDQSKFSQLQVINADGSHLRKLNLPHYMAVFWPTWSR